MRTALTAIGLGGMLLISSARIWTAEDRPAVGDLSQSASVEVSRTHQVWLNDAEEQLKAGQFPEAISLLQKLLDAEPAFVSTPQGYEHSDSAARKLLETLPASWLDRYEDQFGGIARTKLKAAQRNSDLAAIRRVAEQYPLTQAGFEALRLSAVWLFDHGEFLAASAGFQAVSEHRFVRQQSGPKMPAVDVLRWAGALSQLGQQEDASRIVEQYALNRNDLPFKNLSAISKETKPTHAGTPSSSALWQREFLLPHPAEKIVRSMREEQRNRGFSPLSSFSPIIVGDLVISRSFEEIKACDRKTGVVRWRKSIKSQTVQVTYESLMNNPQFREMISWQLAMLAFANRSAGTLSSDGSRVYVILTDHLRGGFTNVARWAVHDNFRGDWKDQRLGFCQLMALDIATGKELWRLPEGFPPREQPSGWIRPIESSVFFLGPPLPMGDSLFIIGQKEREIRLYQLAAKTGKVEWSLPLATTELPLMKDPLRRRLACPIRVSNGLVLCPTGAGALVAVDSHSRHVRWAYRYSRDDLPALRPGPWAVDGVHAPEDRWWTGWRDVGLVTQNDVLLFVSPESDRLHAVSLRTGKPMWNQPRSDGLFLVNAGNDQALVIGSKSLRVLNLEDGKISWSVPIPLLSGRGNISAGPNGPRYLLPLQAGGVLEIDPAQKTTRRTFPLDSKPLGNLAVSGETIVAQTFDRLLCLAPLKLEPQPPADALGKLAWAKSQREAGRFREAVTVLKELAKDAEDPKHLDDLRETLLLELSIHPKRVKLIAEDLVPLLDTAELRIRGWGALAVAEKKARNALDSLGYWLKLLEENPTGSITAADDPALDVEYSRDLQGAVFDLFASAEPAIKQELESRLNAYREKMIHRRDPFAVSRFARWFDQLKWGRELIVDEDHRTGIGQTAIEQQLQLWALTEAKDNRPIQAMAYRRLAEDRLAELRRREAAFFLEELRDRFKDVQFPDGQSVQAFVLKSLPEDSPPRNAESLKQDRRSAGKLRIDSERRAAKLPFLFSIPVEAQPGSLGAELNVWLDPERRRLQFSGAGHSGEWELALPEGRSAFLTESFLRGWAVGPILVLQYGSDLLGIAPLDDHGEPRPRVLWRVEMFDSDAYSEGIQYRQHRPPPGFGVPDAEFLDPFQQAIAQVGPVSAGMLVYQSHGRLVAIETATGRRLWSRSQLPPDAMIAGDARHVLLIERQTSRVTVLRMLDGRIVATRDLPASGQLLTWWKGRALFQENSPTGVNFSLWDAAADRYLWKTQAPLKSLGFQVDSRLWGFITPEGELTLIDAETGQPLATRKLDGIQSPGQVYAAADESGIYLAIDHAKTAKADREPSPIADDLPLRHPIIAGSLHGFDRRTGKPLWHSSWGHWAFPLEQPAAGPVLVLHHREKAGDNTRAVIRCLEKRTGKQVFSIESDETRETPRWSGSPDQGGFELKAYGHTARFRSE